MTPTRTRFCCPRCGAALTPWSRELELAEALSLHECHTWLLPFRWFMRRDRPLLRGSYLGEGQPAYPWLLPPLQSKWLRIHPDPRRTSGCCGLNFWDQPNLLCECGHEVGIGHTDCIGPYWYALHDSVTREDAADAAPWPAIAEGLARAREKVAAPIVAPAHVPEGSSVSHDEPSRWGPQLHLVDVELECGGGVDDPALVLRSPQLPAGTAVIVRLPWCQLVRMMVLKEKPWGSAEVPLSWRSERPEGPHVSVSRHNERVLLTAWGPGRASWSLTLARTAWSAAVERLRG